MTDTQRLVEMSPKLHKVVERAKERPEERFTSLAHLIDVPALTRVYQRIRKDAAVGVDGITKDAYGARPGGQPPGPAREDEVEAISTSADHIP
jgi:hypothetical protein